MREEYTPQIESRADGVHIVEGKKITPADVKIGNTHGRLYRLEKTEPPAAAPSVEAVKADEGQREAKAILEKARAPLSEGEVFRFYGSENPFGVEIEGKEFQVHFVGAEVDQYLKNPERVAAMDFEVHPDFEIDQQLRAYRERIIELEKKSGRRLFDSAITAVSSYNVEKDVVGVRDASYLDIAVTNNFGLDVKIEPLTGGKIVREGKTFETLREIESPDGRLRPFSESLLANVLGIGGILITRDGQLVIPQRRMGSAVASLEGTYGLSASGNAEWDRRRLEEVGLKEHLAGKMRKELKEELGLKARRKGTNLGQYLIRNMEEYVKQEIGLDTAKGEVLITPLAFSRDLVRGGLPQMFYLFQSELKAEEIPERMAASSDAKKEYNQVITIPFTPEIAAAILGNKIQGMKFNQEIRAAVAYAYSAEAARKLIKE